MQSVSQRDYQENPKYQISFIAIQTTQFILHLKPDQKTRITFIGTRNITVTMLDAKEISCHIFSTMGTRLSLEREFGAQGIFSVIWTQKLKP